MWLKNLNEGYRRKVEHEIWEIDEDRLPEVETTSYYVIDDVDDPYKIRIHYSYPEWHEQDMSKVDIYTEPLERHGKVELCARFLLRYKYTRDGRYVKKVNDEVNKWISRQSKMTLHDLSNYFNPEKWDFTGVPESREYLNRRDHH